MSKLIVVDWVDASFQGDGQLSDDELVPGIWVQTAGIFVRENKSLLCVALEKTPEDDEWRHIATIPKPYIRKRRLLNRTSRSRAGKQIVYLRWIDASFQQGQHCLNDINTEPVQMESVGILAAESRNWLALSLHHFHANNRPWKYVAHIRKNYILEQRRYRL